MLYFANLKDNTLRPIISKDKQVCNIFKEALKNTDELISVHTMLTYVKEALIELETWCRHAPEQSNNLVQDLNKAEKLCRAFLLEFRSYLDHIETHILRNYGKESEIYSIFKTGTHQAYDISHEYAFTYNLRNYSQHCKNSVHSILRNTVGIRPVSNPQSLLREYKKWKTNDKVYIESFNKDIDLQNIFECTYNAISYNIQQPVIQYLLDHNNVGVDITYLRTCGDQFVNQSGDDVSNLHLIDILHQDDSSATVEEYHSGVDVKFTANKIDWKSIYEITDSMKPKPSS